MRPNTKAEEVNPTLNERTYEHIDLTALIEDQGIKTTENLKASIEVYQEEIVDRLPAGWSRAGTYPKELVTSIGTTFYSMESERREKGMTEFEKSLLKHKISFIHGGAILDAK